MSLAAAAAAGQGVNMRDLRPKEAAANLLQWGAPPIGPEGRPS